jgi:hypothetical protein
MTENEDEVERKIIEKIINESVDLPADFMGVLVGSKFDLMGE